MYGEATPQVGVPSAIASWLLKRRLRQRHAAFSSGVGEKAELPPCGGSSRLYVLFQSSFTSCFEPYTRHFRTVFENENSTRVLVACPA
jgi:hypothetical protein